MSAAPSPEASPPGPAPAAAWRLARLLDAPHRLGFFAAALLLGGSAGWWAAMLSTRWLGMAVPWAVPPPVAHGLLMSLGFMPLFMVGFLFTAGPRWLGLDGPSAPELWPPVLAMVGGWAVTIVGFHAGAPLAAAGVATVTAGWARLTWRFVGLFRASRAPDRLHAGLVALSCAVGVAALALAAAGLARAGTGAVRVATQLALWGFLAPTFAIVSHRMIPFFTASALPTLQAWRPNLLLWAMVGVLWFEGVFAIAALLVGPLPAPLHALQAAVELPAAVLLLYVARRWGLVQSLRIRLLGMLHAGFVWFGLALALAALSHALMAANGGERSLGLAPLHALTMGYLGATLVAMITRVSAGHSGRALAADDYAWTLYWVLQAAVVLRVAAALGPPGADELTVVAALAWATAAIGWARRYGGWFGRPRIDGRPG
jgi:uncharacterized protein involved in response to NO